MPLTRHTAPMALRSIDLCSVTTVLCALVTLGLLLGLAPRSAAAESAFEPQVQQMYVAYYGRPGDPAGVAYWASELAAVGGNWIPELVDAFGASTEYTERFGQLDDVTLINNLFLMMFNRNVDDIGLAYYEDLLNGSNVSGYNPEMRQSTLAQIALDIANGAQPGTDDALALGNKIAAAMRYTDGVDANNLIYGPLEIGAAVAIIQSINAQPSSLEDAESAIDQITTAAGELNDTGIVFCGDDMNILPECPVDGYPDQDGEFGRDVTHAEPSDGDVGFSFTKLDADGNELPASAMDWSCVRDNVTGLVWEVKTTDGGLRDYSWEYSWYDSTGASAEPGIEDGGACATAGRCDTEKYVSDVNTQLLCGLSSWRLPTPDELVGLLHYGRTAPAIDTNYFPNTTDRLYWTALTENEDRYSAWAVFFYDGKVFSGFKQDRLNVRLVSGASGKLRLIDNGDGTITDPNTELMWSKCSYGQGGEDCEAGTPEEISWQEALAYAKRAIVSGYDDWRLPNVKELQSLVDYNARAPSIDETVFPNTPSSRFWTSSPHAYDSDEAWIVVFNGGWIGSGGKISFLRGYNHVRLVRDARP